MNNNIFSEMENFSEQEKQRMSRVIDQLQTRDSLRLYNSLVERCFQNCVNTFYRKTLNKPEEACVSRCAEKFLRLSTQAGMRFSEISQGTSTSDKQ